MMLRKELIVSRKKDKKNIKEVIVNISIGILRTLHSISKNSNKEKIIIIDNKSNYFFFVVKNLQIISIMTLYSVFFS